MSASDGIRTLLRGIDEQGKPPFYWVVEWDKRGCEQGVDAVRAAWESEIDTLALVTFVMRGMTNKSVQVVDEFTLSHELDSTPMRSLAGTTAYVYGQHRCTISVTTPLGHILLRGIMDRNGAWLGHVAALARIVTRDNAGAGLFASEADHVRAMVTKLPTLSELLNDARTGERRQPVRT